MAAQTTISTTFGSATTSSVLVVKNAGERIDVAISGTYAATIRLERAVTPDQSAWELVKEWSTANATVAFSTTSRQNDAFRLNATSYTSGSAVTTLGDVDKVGTVVETPEGEAIYSIRDSGILNHKEQQYDEPGTPGTGVTAKHYSSNGVDFTSVLTLTEVAFTIGDNAALADSALIYTMPSGDIRIHGAAFSVGLTLTTGTPTTDTPEFALGSTAASGVNATIGAVAATAEDISGPVVMNDIAGTAEVFTDAIGMSMLSAGAHTIYANIADTWADVDDTAATMSGTITIRWSKLPLS